MGAGPYFVDLIASRIANSNREDQSGLDDGDVIDWPKANEIILAILIGTSKGPIARSYKLRWRNVTDGGSFVDIAHSGGQIEWALDSETVLADGTTLTTPLCSATPEPTWQDGLESAEDNILPDSGTYSLPDEYYTEFQWALSLDNALGGKQYEFELYDITEATVIGTCLAQITTYIEPTIPQTNSRIADASASWQDACDVDIINWNKTNQIILSTYATGGSGSTKTFKLQWKVSGGSFADITSLSTINWSANTVLVDEDPVGTPAGCLTSTISEENEGDNLTTPITMGASSIVEIQWALNCSLADDDTIYEFQLVCITDDTSEVCSCSIKIRQITTPQTDSRIANASASWQGVCDLDITNWDKANEFILASYSKYGDGNNKDFKLQWKESGGSFADVGADTEIYWGIDTVLVDGNTVANGAGCLGINDSIENEGDNSATINNVDPDDWLELQWALGFGSGAQDAVTYEFQLVCTTETTSEVCSCSITTQGVAGEFSVNRISKNEIKSINKIPIEEIKSISGVQI